MLKTLAHPTAVAEGASAGGSLAHPFLTHSNLTAAFPSSVKPSEQHRDALGRPIDFLLLNLYVLDLQYLPGECFVANVYQELVMQLALYIGSIPVFKATEDVAMHLGNDFVLKKKKVS